jgi:hypothetical protein
MRFLGVEDSERDGCTTIESEMGGFVGIGGEGFLAEDLVLFVEVDRGMCEKSARDLERRYIHRRTECSSKEFGIIGDIELLGVF